MNMAQRAGAPNAAGRREHARQELEVAVDFQSEHNFYTGLTQNISEGGLFVATNELRPIGSRVRVRFSLPGTPRPVEVDTEVRWRKEVTALHRIEGAQGIGLRFLNLTPEAMAAIKEFIRRRDSLFYDDE
jgi:uncharacterized protein (TIGR02266 family)